MNLVNRLAKLRAMSLHEIAVRGSYSVFTTLERRAYRRGDLARPDRLRRALVRSLAVREDWADAVLSRSHAPARFFAGTEDGAATRSRLLGRHDAEVRKAREISDDVLRHEIEFFGHRFDFGATIDWHADPISGSAWPRAYHRDVPVGNSRTYGDAKHVWELNRHQFLMDLAKRVFLDGSEQHRAALQSLVLHWQQEAPYGTGPAWACALEPAFRAWSWLWAYQMLRASGPLDPAFHMAWLAGFHDHGHFLYRHLETYTSPYNHLIGEASALFALGLMFPEFAESPAWISRGRTVLESTLPTQFHADGGTVEQSTFYHHATLGFYMLSGLLARQNGQELSPAVWSAIQRGLEFSMGLVQPDGKVPRIGGADDGKPIRLEHLPFFDFRPYLAIGAVLLSRGDLKRAAGRFWEDALWVLGPAAAERFETLPSKEPALAQAFPATGYYIARSAWSETADYICFDCGPQAAGLRRDGVPSAAHGHADCLSFVAHLGGQPVLVDPGFYCYNGEPEWEVHFRKTRAHNTLTVDGLDQARHVHKMAWTHTYTPNLEASSLDGGLGWVRGSHDGFVRGAGVLHRRAVWLRRGGYLAILDEIVGGAGHRATANFQFAPGMVALESGDRAAFEGRFELAWAASSAVSPAVVAGGDGVDGGWIAPSLGVRERAPRLQLDLSAVDETTVLLTILADRDRVRPHVRFSQTRSGGRTEIAAEIVGDGWTDYLVAGAGAVRAGGIQSDGCMAVVRVGPRGVEESLSVAGTYVTVSENAVASMVASAREISSHEGVRAR